MTNRVVATQNVVERWAAEQVVRQHESGYCKQCTGAGCRMLTWASGVLGDLQVGYPTVEPVRHTL